jgi:predicted alpha/beta superfamily hydrolase
VPAAGGGREPIACGHYATLTSAVLGEARRLLVSLPGSGDGGAGSHPLLIQLDAEREVYCHASMAVWYLAQAAERVPEHIVVGIENTDRGRDMALDRGAASFLQFIERELLPFVEANYRTNDLCILSGQSASSVFACYAFLERPELFDACILGSFGLSNSGQAWFSDGLLSGLSWAGLPTRYLFIANGGSDPYDPDGARTRNGAKFADALAERAGGRLAVRQELYAGEGHVPYASLYDGLKWFYDQHG